MRRLARAPVRRARVAIRTTCQELFFFDGGPAWRAAGVPAYVDFEQAVYGTRDIDGLGVKAAPDFDGPPLDPDARAAAVPAAGGRGDRARVPRRALPGAGRRAARERRACRYELSPDAHFVVAPHPEHASVWLLGGGSGHGFKHGPALAERVAAALAGTAALPPHFALGERGRPARCGLLGAALTRSNRRAMRAYPT